MKRAFFALAALTLLSTSSGCCCLDRLFCGGCGWGCCGGGVCDDCCGPYNGGGDCGCDECGGGGPMMDGHHHGGGGCDCGHASAQRPHHMARRMNRQPMPNDAYAGGAGGPPSAQVTYPYYTNRAPRDFLAKAPRGIGP